MPEDPIEGLKWIVPKLLKDLTEAKMWPIKMAQVKHQETLRDSHAPNVELIICIFAYVYIPIRYPYLSIYIYVLYAIYIYLYTHAHTHIYIYLYIYINK